LVDGLRDRLRSEVSTRTKQAPRSASETEKVDSPRADEGSQA
jgi:hypothetical protein